MVQERMGMGEKDSSSFSLSRSLSLSLSLSFSFSFSAPCFLSLRGWTIAILFWILVDCWRSVKKKRDEKQKKNQKK